MENLEVSNKNEIDIIKLALIISKNIITIIFIIFTIMALSYFYFISRDNVLKTHFFTSKSADLKFIFSPQSIQVLESLSLTNSVILEKYLNNILSNEIFSEVYHSNIKEVLNLDHEEKEILMKGINVQKNDFKLDQRNEYSISLESKYGKDNNEMILKSLSNYAYQATINEINDAVDRSLANSQLLINTARNQYMLEIDDRKEVLNYKILEIQNEFDQFKSEKTKMLKAQKNIAEIIGFEKPITQITPFSKNDNETVENIKKNNEHGSIIRASDPSDPSYFMYGSKIISQQIENTNSGALSIASYNPEIIKLKVELDLLNLKNSDAFNPIIKDLIIEENNLKNLQMRLKNLSDYELLNINLTRFENVIQGRSLASKLIVVFIFSLFLSITFVLVKNEMLLRRIK
jgi:hypothetical protein